MEITQIRIFKDDLKRIQELSFLLSLRESKKFSQQDTLKYVLDKFSEVVMPTLKLEQN